MWLGLAQWLAFADTADLDQMSRNYQPAPNYRLAPLALATASSFQWLNQEKRPAQRLLELESRSSRQESQRPQ